MLIDVCVYLIPLDPHNCMKLVCDREVYDKLWECDGERWIDLGDERGEGEGRGVEWTG